MDPMVQHVLASQFGGECTAQFAEDVQTCNATLLLHPEWSDEKVVAALNVPLSLEDLVKALQANPQFLGVCDEYFIDDTHSGYAASVATDAPYLTFQAFLSAGRGRYWWRVLRAVRFHLEHDHAQP